MNFSIFTIAQLQAGLTRYEADFQAEATAGRLSSAECAHAMAEKVRAELAKREELLA